MNGPSTKCNSATATHKKEGEKASNIAQKAAQEAKAASDAQNIAGQQASHQVGIKTIGYFYISSLFRSIY